MYQYFIEYDLFQNSIQIFYFKQFSPRFVYGLLSGFKLFS